MIDLYTWKTPNGRKVSIMLEELGEAYEAHAIDTGKGMQHEPDFLKISPGGKIPAIRDRETGMTLMESGAILLWLAETRGRFLPEGRHRWECLEWCYWQVGQLGPYLGAAHQFLYYHKGKSEFGEERSRRQVAEVYGVLDERLKDRAFLAGPDAGDYTIADMLCWPWVARFMRHEADLNAYPGVKDWYLRIAERPAVVKGYDVPVPDDGIQLP